jgi:hypothetical protein
MLDVPWRRPAKFVAVGRIVNLVLLDGTGTPLGALPPIEVAQPWWQEVEEVVAAARTRDGVDVAILRMVSGTGGPGPTNGGETTYAAQVSGHPELALAPIRDEDVAALAPDPRRAPWAVPGGPAASVAWGVGALASLGTPGATAVQRRTWNLSAIWRLDAGRRTIAWLKQVPAFFAHEPAVIGLVGGVAPGLVPPLLAAGPQGRMLLADVPGRDGYDAGAAECAAIALGVHPVQTHFAGRVEDLFAAGVPDRRLDAAALTAVAAPWCDRIAGLEPLLAELPRRLDDIRAAGVPDTLVHGDLHPGNTRIGGAAPVIMDWGDATVSHPALDILRLTDRLTAPEADALVAAWALRWRLAVPGSDPARAAELMRPVAHLRSAVIYADFLAAIEPSEHVYHATDVPEALGRAVAAAGVIP